LQTHETQETILLAEHGIRREQKNLPLRFSEIFPERLRISRKTLHSCCMFIRQTIKFYSIIFKLNFTQHLWTIYCLTIINWLYKCTVYYSLLNNSVRWKYFWIKFMSCSHCTPPAETHVFRRLQNSLLALLIVVWGKSS